MRKIVASGVVIALLIVAVLITAATAGCGGPLNAAAAAPTPQEILSNAITASNSMKSGTGDFNMSIAVNGDTTKMPAEAKAMLSKPIALTGTFSGTSEPMAADLAMTISFAGQDIPFGLKMMDNKAWIQFMGQWYEAPAELTNAMATATTQTPTDPQKMLDALKAAGIDPTTWITGLTLVGEEDLAGTPTYHLTGSIDINKIITDAMKMMEDKTLESIFPSLGSMATGDIGSSLPSDQELATMQTELIKMFENLSVDMWIAKDGYQLRKADLNMKIVPPPGEDAEGITDITVKAGLNVAPAGGPVAVTPPANAKPFSELEKALGALEGLFSGMLGGE